MKKLFALLLCSVLLLSLGTVAFAADSDPNIDHYIGTTIVSDGMELDITLGWENGFDIELKSGGRCVMNVDGTEAGGKWSLDGTSLLLKVEGEDYPGTLSNGVLTLTNIQDSGLDIIFYGENAAAASQTQSSSGNSGLKARLTPASTPASASLPLDDSLPEPFNWWSRDWYGFWLILEADGEYADVVGDWWDCCGTIKLTEDGTGSFILWDEESTYDKPFAISMVKISKDGRGPHGTLYSEEGVFLSMELQHGDWAVDPKISDYDDMLTIYGDYVDEDGSLEYVVVLRPWGHLWLDITEDDADTYSLYFYEDWYLPLLDDGVTVAPKGKVGSSE